MFSVIVFLLILSFLVIIHELGHFLTALWMKVKVEEFGLGYPPKAGTLFRWRGIPFTFNWLPFGGFVKMEGEDGAAEADVDTLNPPASGKDNVGPFYTKSKRARLIVLLAGVVINFLFGVIAFSIVYTVQGIPEIETRPVISEVAPGSPAEEANLQVGDVLISGADGLERNDQGGVFTGFETSEQAIEYINKNLGETLVIEYQRDGDSRATTIYARPESERPADQGALGIAFQPLVFKFYPWWQMPFRGIWVGLQQSIGLSVLILQAFYQMFAQILTLGGVPEGVAGPVGIVHQASKQGLFADGWSSILNFAGMLSINLAILNALPIPALDGGRATFVVLETFIGKNRRAKIENQMNYFGFGFLLLFISIITFKDIVALVTDIVR